MFEKTKKFVSTHKTEIAIAAVSAVAGGLAVHVYKNRGPNDYLILSKTLQKTLSEAPEKKWVGYTVHGVTYAMTAADTSAVK